MRLNEKRKKLFKLSIILIIVCFLIVIGCIIGLNSTTPESDLHILCITIATTALWCSTIATFAIIFIIIEYIIKKPR